MESSPIYWSKRRQQISLSFSSSRLANLELSKVHITQNRPVSDPRAIPNRSNLQRVVGLNSIAGFTAISNLAEKFRMYEDHRSYSSRCVKGGASLGPVRKIAPILLLHSSAT